MLPKNRQDMRRLAVFAAAGTVNSALCYAGFLVMLGLRWHYNLALVGAYVLGAVLGYALHRTTTFADRRELRSAFGKYAVTLVIMFLLNFALLDGLVATRAFSPAVGQFIAMIAATLAVYRLQTEWVFRCHSVEEPAEKTPAPVEPEPQRRAA